MGKDHGTIRCAVITLSDKGAAGLREDTSGAALQELMREEGYDIRFYRVIPDNIDTIAETLRELCDQKEIDLIVTTGGTGVAPSDVTPEAMKLIIEREIPGMAEAMRAASLQKTVHAVISRGICGIRGQTLIINLPGSKKAALENIAVILPALPHTIKKMQGDPEDCGNL